MLEDLKSFVRWLGGWVLFVLLLQMLLAQTPFGRDDSDEDGWFAKRSGADVVVDHRTGCQYFKTQNGITPRLQANGGQVGCR